MTSIDAGNTVLASTSMVASEKDDVFVSAATAVSEMESIDASTTLIDNFEINQRNNLPLLSNHVEPINLLNNDGDIAANKCSPQCSNVPTSEELGNGSVPFETHNCECHACPQVFNAEESEEITHVIYSSWQEFLQFFREVYSNPRVQLDEFGNMSTVFEVNEKIENALKVFEICDQLSLLQKIECEIFQIVLTSRDRLLELLRNIDIKDNMDLFIEGLLEEYLKLLASAIYIAPATKLILGEHMEKLGLDWEMLHKYAYLSFIYMYPKIQENLCCDYDQIENSKSQTIFQSSENPYLNLAQQYFELTQEMEALKSSWKKIEPHMNGFRDIKEMDLRKIRDFVNVQPKEKWKINTPTTEEASGTNEAVSSNFNCIEATDSQEICDLCLNQIHCSCYHCINLHTTFCEAVRGYYSNLRLWSEEDVKVSADTVKSTDNVQLERACQCNLCCAHSEDVGENLMIDSEMKDTNQMYLRAENSNTSCDSPKLINTNCNSSYVQCTMDSEENNDCLSNSLENHSTSQYALNSITNNSAAHLNNLHCSQYLSNPFNDPAISNIRSSETALYAEKVNKSMEIDPDVITPGKCDKSTETMPIEPICNDVPDSLKNIPGSGCDPDNGEKVKSAKKDKESRTGCSKSGVCNKCIKHNKPNSKTAERHLAAITRLGLNKTFGNKCGDKNNRTTGGCGDRKNQNLDDLADDCSSIDDDDGSDTCSNSTVTTQTKDPKQCECCYCGVFGHSIPSVPPMSRNYSEMRDRLRMRLNMKKKIKSQSNLNKSHVAQPVKPPTQPPVQTTTTSVVKEVTPIEKKPPKQKDLESLIQFIEGKVKSDDVDEKKAAKRARQKQKKIDEKEEKDRQEREEARLKLEAMKLAKKMKKKQKKMVKRAQNEASRMVKTNTSQQTEGLNLTGLKNLVAQCPSGSEPKMVTIKRVIEPFSQPTVTITLKGSTPDQDKILYMLKNDTGNIEEPSCNQSKKKKKKDYSNQTPFTPVVLPQYETPEVPLTKKQRQKLRKAMELQQQQQQHILMQQRQQLTPQYGNQKVSNKQAAKLDKMGGKGNNEKNKTLTVMQNSTDNVKCPMPTGKEKLLPTARSVLKQNDGVTTIEIYSMENDGNGTGINKKPPPTVLEMVKNTQTPNGMVTIGGNNGKKTISKNDKCEVTVTRSSANGGEAKSYKLSEVIGSIARPSANASPNSRSKEISLENLRLPPGITITKIEGPIKKTIRASDTPGLVTKPDSYPMMMPIHASLTSNLVNNNSIRPTHKDTTCSIIVPPAVENTTGESKRKKKKKNKEANSDLKKKSASQEIIVSRTGKNGFGVPSAPSNNIFGQSMSQQATIIKTGDNMVTIRSPAVQALHQDLQQMRIHDDSDSHGGRTNIELVNQMSRLSLAPQQPLKQQAHIISVSKQSQPSNQFLDNSDQNTSKKKKKRKNKNNNNSACTGGTGKDIELFESVFQPKDIDLDNGDIDDDERELEAFKRFCLQSVPPERKDKVKVNLNLKDIVLKKKSAALGCT